MSRFRNFEAKVFAKLRRPAPRGKVHRTAFWMFLGYLGLTLLGILPDGWGEFFRILAGVDLTILVPLCAVLLLRWVFSHYLWRVRNRLVLTYLLMGLAPVILFVSLALIALYIFSGQFAIFAGNAEANAELTQIAAQNDLFALHLAHAIASGANPAKLTLPEATAFSAQDSGPEERVGAFVDGKPVALAGVPAANVDSESLPSWLADRSRFHGIVFDQGKLYLRAINTETAGPHRLTVMTSLPLGQKNVDRIAAGIGTVVVLPHAQSVDDDDADASAKPQTQPTLKAEFGKPKATGASRIQVNNEDFDNFKRDDAIVGGHLPKAAHFYDIVVSFYAPMETTDWVTGKTHTSFVHVNSRPSLLYALLFDTSLQVGVIFRNILIAIAIFFGLLELIAFYGGIRLNKTITQSIRDLYNATVAIDKGNFDHRIAVKRRDQLAALSQSFNNMTASLQRLLEEQREKQRLQSELAIAQEVQANLFPQGNLSLASLEVHGVCLPARSVSGDYYDFLLLSENAVGLAIGDISGKGISAALLMATLHSAVRAYRFAGEELVTAGQVAMAQAGGFGRGEQEIECGELFEEPAKILGLLNRHLYRSTQPEKYATLFLAHYDARTSRLTYSNGGQLPPLLLRADGSVTRLDCGGTVVGLLDNMMYEQKAETMRPGDILIAYSDGVTEPENEFGDFGEDRLVDVVRRNRHLPLDVISGQVIHALRSWIGDQEQPDDITLVLARYGHPARG